MENIKALMEQTRIPPQVGKYKVFIIDEVHMLSTAAFNAFLKTLEEPPAHVVFILATTEKHKILPTILSRCQIYDFERMTVSGIVNQLKKVAGNEGIKYEEEALEVIAEKADGGMRDALSIFDQAASFCQGDITYAKVIEDLNVLDSDNYFSIVDLCLENKTAELMALLDGIIRKGFDGANLISGLALHVRNVLMAKDEQTLPLLHVGERQTARYREQAARCTPKFLYNALRIMNECDVNYRQSGNKRLLVELTLIEISQLTQPDDDSAGQGRGPKRLKSLFKRLIGTRPQKAMQVAEDVRRGNEKTASADVKNAPAEATKAVPAGADDTKPTPLKGLKLSRIGKTFDNLRHRADARKPVEETPLVVHDDGTRSTFTEEELLKQWMAMCTRMPEELTGLAARMKNIEPKITSFPDIEVVVDNKILMDDIQKIRGRIRNTLAQALKNSSLSLNLRLARPEEIKRIPTKLERFEKLKTENRAFARLSEELKLELD